jgi:hypothetical protein
VTLPASNPLLYLGYWVFTDFFDLDYKVYEDAEMSESVYSDEEEDIEEAEQQNTNKPNQYSFAPLKLGGQGSKRESTQKKTKRDSKRELKRISERDPTPYYHFAEHAGKENESSTYTLGQRNKERALSSPSPVARTSHKNRTSQQERHSRKSIHSRTHSKKRTHSCS